MSYRVINAIKSNKVISGQDKIIALVDIASQAFDPIYGKQTRFNAQDDPYLEGLFVWENSALGFEFWKNIDRRTKHEQHYPAVGSTKTQRWIENEYKETGMSKEAKARDTEEMDRGYIQQQKRKQS